MLSALDNQCLLSDKGFSKWGLRCSSGERHLACLARCGHKEEEFKRHLLISGNNVFVTAVKVEYFVDLFTHKYKEA